MRTIKLSSINLIFLVSIFICIANNGVLFSSIYERLDIFSLEGGGYIIVLALMIIMINALFFLLFGQKYLLKPILILSIIISAILSYFTQELGVIFETDMIRNIAETVADNNQREAVELISRPLLWHLFLFGLLPSLFVFFVHVEYKTFFKELAYRILSAILIVAVVISLFMLNYKYMSFFSRENNDLRVYITPLYPILSLRRYIDDQYASKEIVFKEIGKDAVQNKVSKTRTVGVMVVGETARADHFSLNGYTQETNPQLKQQQLSNFRHVSSCGTSTAFSVPCMFSFLDRSDYSPIKAVKESNILDVLTTAGIKTVWIDNNSSCKGVCKRIESINYKQLTAEKTSPYYANGDYYDGFVVDKLDDYINSTQGDLLIVFHSFGSHGPSYYKRYPSDFAKFTPFCKKRSPQECNNEEIINAYDNTILYTDDVLNRVIEHLKQSQSYESFMFYASDHGESLGENGVYLHGLPYFIAPKAQTHIPMLAWFSGDFIRNHQLNMNDIALKKDQPYSHDNISHTLLGLFNVSSKLYKPDHDLFLSKP